MITVSRSLRVNIVAVICCLAFAVTSPAHADGSTWGPWLNRTLHDGNQALAAQWRALSRRLLPEAEPSTWRVSAGNLVTTWVAEPWQALSLAAAGLPTEALEALARARINIFEGRLGLDDVAGQRGLDRAPYADIGLALCVRGVPEGPYIVMPVIGGRTLRDGLADFVVANALIYASLLPFTGPAPSLELFVLVEIVDNVPILLLAERMGRADVDEKTRDDYEASRAAYLAKRRANCEVLRARREASRQ
ncbi:MlaA family lipoprotein [Falsiroseomonas sp.]|uniref:MlaA family lipoprotein n=1 Tax=Falsiroseomonas sp. TaxID=2870721 RepID=UPI0034A2F1EB